ncbi:hypothetical protein UFOVP132_83 [uncultured Caudovirales phage]|uniref:Uncharacterized protein n=1 Tax=uncultured Caudovirales phage TaxID=2100421 RepID=A0A6J5LAS4_9CAUD|nr:hypothetical protein UFOVP132_83 [uncultured Caudovirales phage]
MDIHYKIIEVHPNEHAIVVRYFSDALSEEMLATNPEDQNRRDDGSPVRCRTDYNINLPIPAPEGEELHKFLIRSAPVGWFDMQAKIFDPEIDTTLSHINALVDQHVTITNDEIVTAFQAGPAQSFSVSTEQIGGKMTDDDITALLKKAAAGQAG